MSKCLWPRLFFSREAVFSSLPAEEQTPVPVGFSIAPVGKMWRLYLSRLEMSFQHPQVLIQAAGHLCEQVGGVGVTELVGCLDRSA